MKYIFIFITLIIFQSCYSTEQLINDAEKLRHANLELYKKLTSTYDIEIYGQPDQISYYYDTEYYLMTYTWNCVNGKIRIITYQYKWGVWISNSIYTITC